MLRDDDVDLTSRFGGRVQLVDQPGIVERVDLDHDRGLVVALPGGRGDPLDLAREPRSQVEGRDEQFSDSCGSLKPVR